MYRYIALINAIYFCFFLLFYLHNQLEDNLPCQSNLSTLNNSLTNNSLLIDNSININQSKAILNNSIEQLNTCKPIISKVLPRRISKKNGEIMLIDLTSDDSKGKIIKQKKNQKKLSWIQNISRRNSTITGHEDTVNTEEIMQQLEDTFGLVSLTITNNHNDSLIGENMTKSEIDLTSVRTLFKLFGLAPDESDSDINIDGLSNTKPCELIEKTEFASKQNLEIISTTEPEKVLTNEITVQTFMDINEDVEVTTTATKNSGNNKLSVENNVNKLESVYTMEVTPGATSVCVNNNNNISVDVNSQTRNTTFSTTEYSQSTILHINNHLKSPNYHENETTAKIQDTEFHDGLSLLASVSQELSHLETPINKTCEMIKVKNCNSLLTFGEITEDTEYVNKIINTYPDDDIDKVALHVEVSSSDDVLDPCTSTVYTQETLNNYFLPNEISSELPSTSAQIDSSYQSDKDEANVILNGETIVLLQKSPNSNLYIINKAVENREHINEDDETIDLSVKNTKIIDKVEDTIYPYEMYDPMYRIGRPVSSTPFDLPQRSTKIKPDLPDENTRALDLKKLGKKKNNETQSPRRRRVKQEFNSCSNVPGNPSCQDLVDAHSLHIPPSTSLSNMYHSNYTAGDLFISCRQNCTTVGCGLPVNHPSAPLLPHPKSSRCSCLNCTYDIVTHCGQCIMPPVQTDTTTSIDTGYYIPIQQTPVIQDCSITKPQQFDEKLIRKIEAEFHDQKPTNIYKPEMNSKLPLKKRFKCMVSASYDKTPIKIEKNEGNYPGTPMISIAALESEDSVETPSNLIVHQIHSEKIIRRNYRKEDINGYHKYTNDNKRNSVELKYSPKKITDIKRTKGQIGRPLKKVKELESPTKNATRRTRSSQRKIPKINYSCMDVDSEWNPSVEIKRKRKKTSR